MELRCQRKGSVSYGLGADFSLPHCLVGDKVSESSAEPSPAGISEPRAEISWCIVMVQRSGTVSRGTAVGCIFLSFSTILMPEGILRKEAFHSGPVSCHSQIVDGYCVLLIAVKPILHIYARGGLQPLGVQE